MTKRVIIKEEVTKDNSEKLARVLTLSLAADQALCRIRQVRSLKKSNPADSWDTTQCFFDMIVSANATYSLIKTAYDDGWLRRDMLAKHHDAVTPAPDLDELKETFDMIVSKGKDGGYEKELANLRRARNQVGGHYLLDASREFVANHPDYIPVTEFARMMGDTPVTLKFTLARYVMMDSMGLDMERAKQNPEGEVIKHSESHIRLVMKIQELVYFVAIAYARESRLNIEMQEVN